MNRLTWPQDWNRPLSLEEQRIGERIDCAPDSGLGEVLQISPTGLQAESSASVSGGGRTEDAGPCNSEARPRKINPARKRLGR